MKRLIFILYLSTIIASGLMKSDVPKITSVTPLDPVGFFVKWRGVTSDSKDPVLGYKIRLWKIEEDNQGFFNLVNGDETPGLILEDRPLEPVDINNPPKSDPIEVLVDDVSTEKAKIYNVKYNTLYEIRIMARKHHKDGPISDPARVKIMKGDAYLVVVQKRPEEACVVSIATNVTVSDEAYYHLETMYL